jgi:ABC-type nitrate/sulfonate/bicarbonate transport system permease component
LPITQPRAFKIVKPGEAVDMQPLPAGPLPLVAEGAEAQSSSSSPPLQSWKRARGLAEGLARHWLLFALILLWQYVSVSNPALSLQLPPPTEILSGAWELIQKGTLQSDTLASLRRVGLALLAASLVGFPLGALLGASRRFAWSVEPVVNFFRPIPPLAWIPLSILWFGIADAQNEFIIFLAGVFPILLNTMEGVRDVDRQLVRAARTLGASRLVIAYSVVLPAALPQMFVGLRVGTGIAWMALVAGELVAATTGLGYLINQGRYLFRPDYVIVGMVMIGLIGLMLDGLIRLTQTLLMPWWRLGER